MTPSLRAYQASSSEVLRNGSFKEWDERQRPSGWSIGAGSYSPDRVMAGRSLQAIRLTPLPEEEGKSKPLTIHQTVKLKPHTEYEFAIRTAQEGEGTTLVRIQGMKDGKPSSDTVLDWSNQWSSGYPWHPLRLKFRSGEGEDYRILIVHHARVGNSLWLEEGSLRPVVAQEGVFTLFRQSIMIPLGEDPDARRSVSELFLRTSPGEFEPGFLGLEAGEPLEGVDLRLERELKGPGGASLAPELVSVRMSAPDALLPVSKPRRVEVGEKLGWWITVQVPESATPGLYHGVLQLLIDGQTSARLPFIVEVEAFSLPKPEIAMFVYHNERYFPKGGFLTAKQRAAYYKDMKDHGMNTVTVYNNPDVDGVQVDFDHDKSWLLKESEIEALNKGGYLLDAEEVNGRYNFGLKPVMDLIAQSELVAPEQPVLFLAHKRATYNWGGIPSAALKTTMEQWFSHQTWPKPLYYVNDEIEGHPDRIAAARKVFDRLEQLAIPLTTVSANVAVKELGHAYNVWVQLEKRVTPEMAQLAKEYGAQLWAYNCNMHTENAQLTRALFGLWAYRTGIGGVGLWAYYDAKDWFADAEGTVHGSNGRFGFARICPSPDGPIPTISWETSREGVKDYRYAMLFDRLLKQVEAAAEAMGNEVSGEKAERAQELKRVAAGALRARKSLLESIPFDAMAVIGSNPYGAQTQSFVPVLGMGDARLVSEQKREGLAAYVRRMLAVLEEE